MESGKLYNLGKYNAFADNYINKNHFATVQIQNVIGVPVIKNLCVPASMNRETIIEAVLAMKLYTSNKNGEIIASPELITHPKLETVMTPINSTLFDFLLEEFRKNNRLDTMYEKSPREQVTSYLDDKMRLTHNTLICDAYPFTDAARNRKSLPSDRAVTGIEISIYGRYSVLGAYAMTRETSPLARELISAFDGDKQAVVKYAAMGSAMLLLPDSCDEMQLAFKAHSTGAGLNKLKL